MKSVDEILEQLKVDDLPESVQSIALGYLTTAQMLVRTNDPDCHLKLVKLLKSRNDAVRSVME